VLEDAIILCGNCPSVVWLWAKVKLTGAAEYTVSGEVKNDIATRYPRYLDTPTLNRLTLLEYYERNYLNFIEEVSISPVALAFSFVRWDHESLDSHDKDWWQLTAIRKMFISDLLALL
jgi:hypothetical protein